MRPSWHGIIETALTAIDRALDHRDAAKSRIRRTVDIAHAPNLEVLRRDTMQLARQELDEQLQGHDDRGRLHLVG